MIAKRALPVLMLGAVIALAACSQNGDARHNKTPDAKDEAGQVVARVNGEEITIHQLNTEAATVPATGLNAKDVQADVLRAIVYRTMLRQAAVKEKMDRNPNVRLLIEGAGDKVLAETYLNSQTVTTPPPTSGEIEKFITDNPLQFAERRIYSFQRITLAVERYSDLMVPLFDQKDSFGEFEAYLNENAIPFTNADVRLPSTEFPKQVQDELAKFGVGDNVVVRGEQSIAILKIKNWVEMPVDASDAKRAAENAVHQTALQARIVSLRDQLTHDAKVEFLGDFAGMGLAEGAPQGDRPARSGKGDLGALTNDNERTQ